MQDDHLWAAVKITEAAVTQLFNGASTPNEVRRGQQIGEIVAELYTAIYAGIVEADYRVGKIGIVESSDEETQADTLIQQMNPVAAAPEMVPDTLTQQLQAVAAAQNAESTIFFCFDAHLYPQTKKLLEEIQKTAKQCTVILLRDPYDKEFVRADVV